MNGGTHGLPGVARRQVTFLVLPRKVTKRGRPRCAAPAGFPPLLDWSGFLINSHDPLRGHVLKHIRQNSLTSLRYSAAHRGNENSFVGRLAKRNPPDVLLMGALCLRLMRSTLAAYAFSQCNFSFSTHRRNTTSQGRLSAEVAMSVTTPPVFESVGGLQKLPLGGALS